MASRQKPIFPSIPRWLIGWSRVTDGCALACFKTIQKLQTNEFWFDLELGAKGSVEGGEQEKLRCFWDKFIYDFLKEICESDCFRPLHPMLGDGQSVDLFKLFWIVREKGGCDTVSKNGLWDSVAEVSGLGSGVASAVKVIYIKYFDTLDRWLQRIIKVKDLKGGLLDSGADLGGFLMELESEFKGFLSQVSDQRKKDGEYPHLDLEKSDLNFTDVGKFCNGDKVWSFVGSDGGNTNVDEKKNVDEDEDTIILDSSIVKEEPSNRKRKRACHSGMLHWVIEVAKNPCDPEIGSLPERSRWRSYGSEELWKQVLLAREAMFLQRNVDSSAEQAIWQKQKMHPSMYDDPTGSEKLRHSQRLLSVKECRSLPSLKKCRARACSESSSGTQSDLEDHLDKQSDPLTADSVIGLFMEDYKRKRIPVGPLFQAKVPEWTGETYESDSKWSGTQVWPLKDGEHNKYLIERDRIGKGRQDSCGCQFSGSVECVRFHVAEKRMRVKLELGSAFNRWKFDKMGEEVALAWRKEEEKKFQAIVRSNPASMDKCFWDEICKSFPSKNREDLVSYYYNVFLLHHRGYQNRSTSSNIDSDDDETELGSSTKSPGSILCTPKKPHLIFRL
ncbi:hypothetical protein F0562_014909 [Nyssa sinensis]|uniref:ARID domain-containing protein n=1 Tax=Nyssa sinensis TaxID=561372 RepID=A0A5J4ZP34_9ASTE|nr:hypothetical protein F0562_014909 [Nyssa sinensis]